MNKDSDPRTLLGIIGRLLLAPPYSPRGTITANHGRRRNGKTGFIIESGTAEMNHLNHVFDSQINEWESDPDLEDRGFTYNPEVYADLFDMRYVDGNPFNPHNFETWPKDLLSPVVFWVHCNFNNSGNSHSAFQNKLDMGVSNNNQGVANDSCYWTGITSALDTEPSLLR